ncbi:unnamed protein product, partial [Ixodes hexagonus]
SAVVLEGSSTSYAQLRRWQAGPSATLSLDFQTQEPNGLLLYADDGGHGDFVELKLVEGALRLRLSLGHAGAAPFLLTVGRNLHDGAWHKAEIVRDKEETRLRVDDQKESGRHPGPPSQLSLGNHSSNSFVYLGGVPSWYGAKLAALSLPTVFFEPRLRGALRNVVYASEEGRPPKKQEPIGFKGVRLGSDEPCEQRDPCQHGGACISTDSGPVCDCRGLDYEGAFCDQGKRLNEQPSEATFRGHEFLSLEAGRAAIVSGADQVSLLFKTRQPSALLWHSGDGADYMQLSLKDGGLLLSVSLGAGVLEKTVRPARVRFDDNQWHRVVVHRKVRQMSQTTSFYHVELVADSLQLDLIDLSRSGNRLVQAKGNIHFVCQEVDAADPVTFTTRDSFLALPSWDDPRTGSVSLRLRTVEPDGLLLYNSGSQGDLFALELLEGQLHLLLDLGSGPVKVRASPKRLHDGHWHQVQVTRSGRSGRLSVDDAGAGYVTPGNSNQLDLEGPLFVGGVGTTAREDASSTLPGELWSGALRLGFVGCLRDLVVNGKAVDLASYAQRQDSGAVRPSCHRAGPQCASTPCLHGGKCTEGWNRFLCDCGHTGFTGPVCAKEATTLRFNGEQFARIQLGRSSRSEAEHLRLRFQSPRPNGLLLATAAEARPQAPHTALVLSIESARLKVSYNLGDGNKIFYVGQGLDDDRWHSMQLDRRGHRVEVKVDQDTTAGELRGQHLMLEVRTLHVGAVTREGPHFPARDLPGFVGQMQQLQLNGRALFEMARQGHIPNLQANIYACVIRRYAQMTAQLGPQGEPSAPHQPVTFRSRLSFVGLPQLKAYSSMHLHFQFKTLEPSGLLLYNAGKGQDFVAVELVDGHLHYLFNLGDGPRKVRSNTASPLNDNRWHAVTLGRSSLRQHSLVVDDRVATVTSPGSNVHLDLDGLLYLGGVRRGGYSALPKLLSSRTGFQAGLNSNDTNIHQVHQLSLHQLPIYSYLCLGTLQPCPSPFPRLREMMSIEITRSVPPPFSIKTLYTHTSPRATPTRFDLNGHRTGTHVHCVEDVLITATASADVLGGVPVLTSRQSQEAGKLLVTYSAGGGDVIASDPGLRVNDGRYHVARVSRSDANVTLWLDDRTAFARGPKGRPMGVLGGFSVLEAGGLQPQASSSSSSAAAASSVQRPFEGVMTGLVFDGVRVLDLAAENDPRVRIQGDVQLVLSIPYESPRGSQRMQQVRLPARAALDSDSCVIFGQCWINVGGNCEDSGVQCDDLITAVYVQPTARPAPSPPPSVVTHQPPDCDDEDCLDGGSGAGPHSAFSPTPSTTAEDDDEDEDRGTSSTQKPAVPSPPTSTHRPTSNPVVSSTRHEWSIVRTFTVTRAPWQPRTTQGAPTVISVPIPELTVPSQERQRPTPKAKSSADSTALVIGVIAGILISIVIVALLVYQFRSRPAGGYKVDQGGPKGAPSAGSQATARGAEATTFHPVATPQQLNGALQPKPSDAKRKNAKDLREWYV